MANEDWLTIDNVGNNQADLNQEVQVEYDYENGMNDLGSPSKRGCSTRRMFLLGLLCLTVVIGASIGAWVTVREPSSTSTGGASSHEKNKLENESLGSNRVPAPTPAISYGGRPTVSPEPTGSNAFKIADIIDGVARNGGQEFENAGSYQSLAKKWVLTQDFPVQDGSSMTTEQQATQLYSLACIFYATFSVKSQWTDFNYGPDIALPGWYSRRGWLGTAQDVCSNWHGITCNDQGRILKIELDTNGLTGALPSETALLHETLNTIDLYNNILHNVGDVGNNFLGELTNLEYLYLGTTYFQYDGVPPALGKLTKLKELDFSESLYNGALDGATFSNLSNLRYLVMDGNSYDSSIPSELARLPNLEYLYAGYSSLEGGLDFMTLMPKVVELWLDDNPKMKGPIPTGVGNMKKLASFSAANCGLTGTIPTEIGAMTGMIQMWLNDNDLTGGIPSEMSNIPTMAILNVQNNELKGEMPLPLCKNRRPFGSLEELGADCDSDITCGQNCCTCCGNQCSAR